MEQATQVILLLDTYEKLLTNTQARILRMRFDEDLSLGEIGEICGVSRQAARDAIRKGEEKLFLFENTLHLVSLRRALGALAQQMENGDVSAKDAARQIQNMTEGSDGV